MLFAIKTIAKPIIAQMRAFWAIFTFSSFPAEVIYKYPAYTTKIAVIGIANIIKKLRIFLE
jgi:hypothetical protein